MIDLFKGTIAGLRESYKKKEVSPVEVCQELIRRIEKHDGKIGAFLRLDREGALRDAAAAADRLDQPLAGVPFAIKDNISTLGIETTCSS